MCSYHGWYSDPAIWAAVQLPAHATLGVVICTPLGQEGVVAYRGLRLFADELERRGIASVRYDPPGHGDGAPCDDPAAPIIGAQSAARLLRSTGCSQIAFVGLSSAALIASAAAEAGDLLVLWSPPASGRQWLRRARSLAAIMMGSERQYGDVESLIGLDLNRAQAAALSASALKLPGGAPALVATRTGESAPTAVSAAEVIEVPGTAEFLDTSSVTSVMPTQAIAMIAEWLAAHSQAGSTELLAPQLATSLDLGQAIEQIQWIGPNRLFAIECSPRQMNAETPVLLLHAGAAEHRVGAGDYQVELARLLASDGVRSIRADRRGTGETGEVSATEPSLFYTQEWIDDQDAIIEAAQPADGRLALSGLCAGGWISGQPTKRPVQLVVSIHPLEYRLQPAQPGEFSEVVPAEITNPVVRLIRDLYRRWAPTWLRRLRARRFSGTDASPFLLDISKRVAHTVLIFSDADREIFHRLGGLETAQRLPNIETLAAPSHDHPMFARSTRERVVGEIRRQVADAFGLDLPKGSVADRRQ